VQTELATANVLGTVFTVKKLKGGGTEVSVEEGTVAVRDLRYEGPELKVSAGEARRILPISTIDHVDNARPGKPKLGVPPTPDGSGDENSGFRLIEINVPDQQAPSTP
jgi:hypothetical protein